ncbi:MAG TPA: hypothetical protein PKA50_02755 [Gemmatimonadales bacterium]|nr:hypothetical protein [Gemmatimonadales bacterium]
MPPNSEIEKLERRWKENPKGTVFAPYAEVLRKNGDHLEARDVLRQGLELHPDHIPGNIVLGRCCLDLREDGPAEAAFTHVLDLDPENVIALKALADITERQGRLMEARTWLARLISVDPSNDEARDQLERVDAAREAAAAAMAAPLTVESPPSESGGSSSSETTATVEVVARTFAPQPSTMAEVSAGEVSEAPLGVDDAVEAALGAYDPPARTREIIAPDIGAPVAELDDADTVPILPVVPRDAPAIEDLEPVELDLVEAARDLAPEPLAGIESDEPFTPPPARGEAEVYAIGGEELAPLELRPSGTGEFQSPDDSADLLALASSASEFQVPDASSELKLAGAAGSEYQTPSGAEELLSRIEQSPEAAPLSLPEPEPEPAPVVTAGPTFVPSGPVTTGFAAITLMPTEELSTSAPAESEPVTVEPVAPVAPAAEITLEVPAYRAPTSYEVPDEAPLPEPEPVSLVDELAGAGAPVAESDATAAAAAWEASLPEEEPEPAPRPSDLKLIFPEDAAEPEPPRVRRISQEVSVPEPATAELEPVPVAEAVSAEPAPVLTESMAELYARQGHVAEALNVYRTLLARQPNDARLAERVRQLEQQRAAGSRRLSYVAVDTGGESVESFFRGLAGARPAGVEGPVDDDGEGAPTRPARDPLSLSAIFGEEPSAAQTPKATEPVQRSGAPDAFSFDQFFGGSASGAPTTGPRQAMPSDEDLDQFQHWLKSLKR